MTAAATYDVPRTMLEVKERLRWRRELWGYASRTERDLKGDVVQSYAFSRAMAVCGQFIRSNNLYLNHWQHAGPIGTIFDYFETPRGLYIGARLGETSLADRVYRELEECFIDGVTPAFSIAMDNYDKERRAGTRYLSAVLLKEISLIVPPEKPANPLCLMGPP